MASESSSPAGRCARSASLRPAPALLVLVVLVSLASADNLPSGSLFAAQDRYGSLIPLLIIGLAALSFAAALLFMLSKIARSGEWEMQAKSEIYQAILTVLFGVLLFSAANVTDRVLESYAGGTLFDAAQGYLNQVTCLSALTTLKMEGYKIGAQYLAGMKSRYYANAWGFSFPTYPGFEVIERALDLIQMFIIPFTSSLYVQSLGLDIIRASAMTLLLPVGILLRLFPPTREAAGFLIAASFALYFVLPFTYLIHKEIMEPLYYEEFGIGMCEGGSSTTAMGTLADGSGQSVANNIAFNLTPRPIGRDLLKFTTNISYVAVQAVFLPALSMVIVVTFIRTAARFFAQGM